MAHIGEMLRDPTCMYEGCYTLGPLYPLLRSNGRVAGHYCYAHASSERDRLTMREDEQARALSVASRLRESGQAPF